MRDHPSTDPMPPANVHVDLSNYFHPQIPSEHLFRQLSVMTDLCGFLRVSLEECGHPVSIGVGNPRPDAVNIYFEWFLNSPDYAARLAANGYRYGIVCTELLTEDGRYNPYDHEIDRSRMIFANFARDARHAAFIWCLMEESVPVCRALNPNAHFLPLGFVEPRQPLSMRAPAECYLDFLMCGVLNERRGAIVAELTRRGHRALAPGLQPEHVRDSMIECARVSLSVQKTEGHQIFSFGRINHALVNKVPILLEYDGAPTYMSKFCRLAPKAAYVDACVEFLAHGDPAAVAAANYAAFRREMPMRPIMARLLADTEKGRREPGPLFERGAPPAAPPP